MKTVIIAAAAIIAGISSAQAQEPNKPTPAVNVCPARVQALATYQTIDDVPGPFEKLPLPKALTADEPIEARVARSGATGSTIVEIPDAEQSPEEKRMMAEGKAVAVYHTQPVRVFADTARVNAACRAK
jgi:hypothetical protein